MKKKAKRRTKYESIDLVQVEKLAALGLIDKEIANVLSISKRTLEYYKKKPEFAEALNKGKIKSDMQVIQSLFKRATGFSKETVEQKVVHGQVVNLTKEQFYPPDTLACIYWTKNRRPKDWRERNAFNLEIPEDERNEFKIEVVHVKDNPTGS